MKTKTILILALSSAITLTSIAQPPRSPQNSDQIKVVVSHYLMNPECELDCLLWSDYYRTNFSPHIMADLTLFV